MYVEISGRQTGKSTRLADHAANELIDNINDTTHKIGLVVHNNQSGERLVDMIIDKAQDKIRYMGLPQLDYPDRTFKRKIKIISHVSDYCAETFNQLYYDEFDFISREVREYTHHINPSGYYCTTPKGVSGYSRHLVDYCRRNDIEIVSYDMMEMTRRDTSFQVPEIMEYDAFNRETNIYPMMHPFEDLPNDVVGSIVDKQIRRHRF